MGRLSPDFFEDGRQKPRAKAKSEGISALSDAEILSLLLNTGNRHENVLLLSERILHEKGGFQQLFFYDDLMQVNGIKETKAFMLLAVREIMRRMPLEKEISILSCQDAYQATRYFFLGQRVEICVCLFLDQGKRLINKSIYQSDEYSFVHVPIRNILRNALRLNASFVLLLHNHPSGNLVFSNQDVELAEQLNLELSLLGILLLDSILVVRDTYLSMRKLEIGPYVEENLPK
jgi:DNA repair protein RadC